MSTELYPEIEPYRTGELKVSDLHTLYYEESGNPNGTPVIFLHGGPGAGCRPAHRQFFDPDHYRIILFDQRGSGKSTPYAEIRENTTSLLIDDIEKLRTTLAVDKWLVFGGSWGSTLALAYASQHPQRAVGLILRGIFLCRSSEVSWFYQQGASQIYPDAWEDFLAPIPLSERHDMVSAYYARMTSEDESTRLQAAVAWSTWEARLAHLNLDPEAAASYLEDPRNALAIARIECHYMINRAFFSSDDALLKQIKSSLVGIPCRIVQGRYDLICPMRTAWEVHKSLPGSELRIVPAAGHSAHEPGISQELVQAANDFCSLKV